MQSCFVRTCVLQAQTQHGTQGRAKYSLTKSASRNTCDVCYRAATSFHTWSNNSQFDPAMKDKFEVGGMSSDKGVNCELLCSKEQIDLVECMTKIQISNETGDSRTESRGCLRPLVAAWTECCLAATVSATENESTGKPVEKIFQT